MAVRDDRRGCICRDHEFKASQIAVAIGRSTRAIQRRAFEEGWRHETRRALGGQYAFYIARRLPKDVVAALHTHYCQGVRRG